MKLHNRVLVNHSLPKDTPASAARPIWKHLLGEAADSTHVQVFSAYYGLDALRELLCDKSVKNRRTRQLLFLFGRKPGPGLPAQLRELLKFKKSLVTSGYLKKNIDVAVSNEDRFFHSKVYQFVRNTRRRTFIGSGVCGPNRSTL